MDHILINLSRDGKTVISSASSGYSASFDGKIAKLEILKMSEQKSGLYKCAATSDYGETQTSAMVKWEQSEEEKKAEMSKMEVDEAKSAQKRRKSATKKDEGEGDQVVPEKRVQIHVRENWEIYCNLFHFEESLTLHWWIQNTGTPRVKSAGDGEKK